MVQLQLDKPVQLVPGRDTKLQRVDRQTTRALNDQMGLDPEERRSSQAARNRETARAALEHRRQEAIELDEKVRRTCVTLFL